MTLRVIENETKIGSRSGTVVIEGDSPEEVSGMQARELAIQVAMQNGLARAGVSGGGAPYPVDADGKSGDALMLGKTPATAFRYDHKVTGGM